MNTKASSNAGARHAILGALRSAAPAQALPQPELQAFWRGPFAQGMPAAQSGSAAPATPALLQTFASAAQGWRAQVLHASPANWPAAVCQALAQHGCQRVLLGAGSPLLPELLPALQAQPTLQVRAFNTPLEDWKPELFEAVDAGITSALGGVADTGSLVLRPGPAEPRTLSLVPPLHIAVLRASQLHASLAAAWAALLPQTGLQNDMSAQTPAPTLAKTQAEIPPQMPTNLLLITGPSKTADIQQVLAFGAHGPKALVIILVDDLASNLANNSVNDSVTNLVSAA